MARKRKKKDEFSLHSWEHKILGLSGQRDIFLEILGAHVLPLQCNFANGAGLGRGEGRKTKNNQANKNMGDGRLSLFSLIYRGPLSKGIFSDFFFLFLLPSSHAVQFCSLRNKRQWRETDAVDSS